MVTLVGKIDPIGKLREARWLAIFFRAPLQGRSKDHIISYFRSARLIILTSSLPAYAVIGTGKKTDSTIAGTVGKNRCTKDCSLPAHYVPASDRNYPVPFFLNGNHSGQSIKSNILLCCDYRHLGIVSIIGRRHCIALFCRSELFDKVSEIGIWLTFDRASELDTDFRAVVAAQNRPVLDKRHPKSLPRSGNGGADS